MKTLSPVRASNSFLMFSTTSAEVFHPRNLELGSFSYVHLMPMLRTRSTFAVRIERRTPTDNAAIAILPKVGLVRARSCHIHAARMPPERKAGAVQFASPASLSERKK